jgi:flagellar basal body-associated protein FliL
MKKIKKETWVVIGVIAVAGISGAVYYGVKWVVKKRKESKQKKNPNSSVQNNSSENQ